jgi:hypothetical protein
MRELSISETYSLAASSPLFSSQRHVEMVLAIQVLLRMAEI